jgi:hypothetical protein
MRHCKHLGKLELPVLSPDDLSLVQRSEEVDRAKYKYTEWLEETAPGTPLYMYMLPEEVKDKILQALPQALLDKEKPGVYFMHMPKPCVESAAVPPHVDRARRTALNIYLKCSNEVTEFYDADEATQTLTAVERFVAKPHDMWALDVSKPHAVLMTDAMERSAISISFRRVRYPELVAYFQ